MIVGDLRFQFFQQQRFFDGDLGPNHFHRFSGEPAAPVENDMAPWPKEIHKSAVAIKKRPFVVLYRNLQPPSGAHDKPPKCVHKNSKKGCRPLPTSITRAKASALARGRLL